MPTLEPVLESLIPKDKMPELPTRIVATREPGQRKEAIQPVISETVAESNTVTLSPQASAKARQEQAYRQRESALKQREADLEAKLKDADAYAQLKSKISSKDFSVAEEMGLNYEEYAEYLIKKQEGEDPATQPLKKLEAEIAGIKKHNEDKALKEYEATVNEYRKEIATVVASNPELASIKTLGSEEAVLQLILDSWEEDGTELTVEEAAKDVKAYLAEEAKRLSILLDKPAEPERKLPPPKSLRTLTQQVAVGATPPSTKKLHELSEAERYAEAIRRVQSRREAK